jgi:hypothetical protein
MRMRSRMVTRGPAAGTETTSLNPSSTSKTSSSKLLILSLHCISTAFDILSYTAKKDPREKKRLFSFFHMIIVYKYNREGKFFSSSFLHLQKYSISLAYSTVETDSGLHFILCHKSFVCVVQYGID